MDYRIARSPSVFSLLFGFVLSLAASAPVFAQEPQPRTKTGKIEQGKKYSSRTGRFSVTVPEAGNPFVRTFVMTESELKRENYDYEEVVFFISDFGQAYGAGVRKIPEAVLAKMAQETSEQTLSTLAWKVLLQWREFKEEPEVVEDTPMETQFGAGLLRVYLVRKASLMARVSISAASGEPKPEPFDTHIAVLVVKQNDRLIYATAEDDYLETNATTPPGGPFDPNPELKKQIQAFFATIAVKK